MIRLSLAKFEVTELNCCGCITSKTLGWVWESPQLWHSAAPGSLFSSSAVVSTKTLGTVCLVVTGRSPLVEELFCLCFQVSLPGKAVIQQLFSLKNGILSHPRSSESPFCATPEPSAELDAEMFLCSAPRDLPPDSAGMMNSDFFQSLTAE